MSHKDPVRRIALSPGEISELRKNLRVRFAVFMTLAVVLSLISIYDHVMVKILMMFLLVILFWHFLKFHLRMKFDIDEGFKCVEQIRLDPNKSLQRSPLGSKMKVQSAYGELALNLPSGDTGIESSERVHVEYLPLSTHVVTWKRSAG